MNIKKFFVDALSSAIELNIGTHADVLKHVTPDVLAAQLPRPLWARLLTACLGAPRVDAQLVVETVGIPNLCEHVPSNIIWACISEIGSRSIGRAADAPAPTKAVAASRSIIAPPPDVVVAKPVTPVRGSPIGASISIPKPTPARGMPIPTEAAAAAEASAEPPSTSTPRPRSPSQRFRQSGTGVRTLGGVRRAQAAASPLPGVASRGNAAPKRNEPAEYETETAVETADWRDREIVVDDEQLVDWQADPGAAVTSVVDDDFSDLGNRKR